MKKHINIVILVLIILNAVLIYFSFFGFKERSKEIEISREDSAIKKISVDYEAIGNPFADIRITDISESDSQINAVATTLGTSFDISGNFSNFQLQEATVELKYDKDKLPEGTTEDDLGILWYDEENNKMVEIDAKVNKERGTITFETEHFSKYVFINITKWHEVWAKQMAKIRDTKAEFSIVFIVDDSGSMYDNDRQNKRIDAMKQAIYSVSNEDRYSIIQFNDSSKVLQDFTNDKEEAEDDYGEFKSNGGTNIVSAVERGISILEDEDKERDKLILLLTDGEDSNLANKKDDLVRKADDLGIVIFGIGLEASETSNLNFDVFSKLATETSGKFYRINDSGLTDIFTEITNATVGIDGTVDTDQDGIPDGLEIAGMRDQFGNVIKTDPSLADTDGDEISDFDEMGKLVTAKDGSLYYERVSDPRVNKKTATLMSRDYRLGPQLEADPNNVWDSGFRANVNGFPFRNFRILDKGKGGICEGFAIITERVFNGNFSRKVDNTAISIIGTCKPYDLTGAGYNNMFVGRNLYSYTPVSKKLRLYRSRVYINEDIYDADMDDSANDGELIKALYYNWIDGNVKKQELFSFSKPIKESTIDNLKRTFKNENKIVTIDLPHHAVNGYALEKINENFYFLYVYDNNYPYDPYSSVRKDDNFWRRNNIIVLQRKEDKTIFGGTNVYYTATYYKKILLTESDEINKDLTEIDLIVDLYSDDTKMVNTTEESDRMTKGERMTDLPIYADYKYLN